MQWFRDALLHKYATFRGRAGRQEYWYFALYYFLIYVGLLLVDVLTGTFSMETEIGFLSGVFLLATLLPTIALAVRRLHDTGRSGLWLLLGVVPLLGAIALLYFTTLESDAGSNAYGEDPKVHLPGA